MSRKDQEDGKYGHYIVIFLDFAGIRTKQCTEDDMEKWYARSGDSECLMGHKVLVFSSSFSSTDFLFFRFSNGIIAENRQPTVMWGINSLTLYHMKITVNVLTLIMNGTFLRSFIGNPHSFHDVVISTSFEMARNVFLLDPNP